MSIKRKLKQRKKRRTERVRSSLTTNKPRVAVFRSAQHIYAQIIDDNAQKTLTSFSSLKLKDKGDKKSIAKKVGQELASKALEADVKEVVFDRGSYRYHGRVQALAEGLREGGLQL